MIYRQTVFVFCLVCLFLFRSPLRTSVVSLTSSFTSLMPAARGATATAAAATAAAPAPRAGP